MKQQNEVTEKKPYLSPTITVLGDIEAITLGFNTGEHLDADFPINTKFSDITLS